MGQRQGLEESLKYESKEPDKQKRQNTVWKELGKKEGRFGEIREAMEQEKEQFSYFQRATSTGRQVTYNKLRTS